jgi:hypothetical protein
MQFSLKTASPETFGYTLVREIVMVQHLRLRTYFRALLISVLHQIYGDGKRYENTEMACAAKKIKTLSMN